MLFTMIAVSLNVVCLYREPNGFGQTRETLESTVYGATDISCHVVTRQSDAVDLMYVVNGNTITMHGWFNLVLTYYEGQNPSQQSIQLHNEWQIDIDDTSQTGYFYFPPRNGVTWGSAPLRANYYLRYYDLDENDNVIVSPYHIYLGYYDYWYNNGSTYTTHSQEFYDLYANDHNFLIEADYVLYDDSIYDYESDYQDAYNNGYNQGASDGYSTGYYDGSRQGQEYAYNQGYNEGYQLGTEEGTSTGYQQGYGVGKQVGYDDAIEEIAEHGGIYTFGNLFGAIADTPILYIRQLLGFDVFGVGAVNILMSMITAVIIIWILRKVF